MTYRREIYQDKVDPKIIHIRKLKTENEQLKKEIRRLKAYINKKARSDNKWKKRIFANKRSI